jgi:myo-inositol-1(or 4)-monophosphatase
LIVPAFPLTNTVKPCIFLSMNELETAVSAARLAGALQLKHFQKGVDFQTKSSSFDLLTIADIESEKAIVSLIREAFPAHNILAEEGKYEKTDSPFTWIIDPLDGTNNFAYHLPIFCTSIALMKEGELILGVVYDVTRNELFSAEKGKGAYLNGESISVSEQASLERAMLITGFYYSRGEETFKTLENIKNFFLKKIIGLRRLGAAALDLCYIASGRASGFWEFELSPWDFAAGKLIIEEAGGKVTGKQGQTVRLTEKSYIVASNGKIHEAMVEVLNQ